MAEIIRRAAERKPDAVAVSDEFGEVTWSQVNERANRLIHALRDAGLGDGETVALLSSNRHEFLEVNAAAASASWVLVPVNWHLTAGEIAYILNDSGAKVLIADREFADKAVEASAQAPTLTTKAMFGGPPEEGFLDFEALVASTSPAEPGRQGAGAPMLYTSATTGHPKGVRSTLLQLGGPVEATVALLEAFAQIMRIVPEAPTFVNAPLYHAAPYGYSTVAAVLGSTIVMRRYFDAAQTLRDIDEYGIGQAYFVPTHFVRFLKLDEATRAAFRGDSLRAVFHTGAPCPPDVKRAMIDWWGPVIAEFYGATEGLVGSGCLITSEEWLAKPGSVGKPLPTCEVSILGERGEVLGAGETGQVYFKNLLGDFEYHRAPDKTAEVHKEPGLYTHGDVGHLDADGYLFLTDRTIDMIVSGGVNIYPAEIEAVLVTHPAVADVAVFGIPNDEFGEEVNAAVELARGFTASPDLEADLERFARGKLAGYKVPRSFEFPAALPRTPTGKLPKRLLRDPYWAGRGRANRKSGSHLSRI